MDNLAVLTELLISSDSIPLEGSDQLNLRAATGYIELGLFEEANGELEEIDPFCRHLPEVLVARGRHLSPPEKMGVASSGRKAVDGMESKRAGLFRRARLCNQAYEILFDRT